MTRMDWAPFVSKDVQDLLRNKFVVIIGDSIQRGIYKDLVRLLQTDQLLMNFHLKQKGEKSILNDKLIDGGCFGEMTNAKHYKEVRQYLTHDHLVRFYFVTRCYGQYMDQILADLATEPRPAIVIMNSCLWDISRYGPLSTMEEYKANLHYLCVQMKQILPSHSLFIWNTALPVGQNIIGGFLTDNIKWMEKNLVYLVKEANFYAVQIMVNHGVDVVDLHNHFANSSQQLGFRVEDGIHWDPCAHRNMTFMILRHIGHAWDSLSLKQQIANVIRENKTANIWRNNVIQLHVTETEEAKELIPTTANSVRMLNNEIHCRVTEREKAKELKPTTANSIHNCYNRHSQNSWFNIVVYISSRFKQCISVIILIIIYLLYYAYKGLYMLYIVKNKYQKKYKNKT